MPRLLVKGSQDDDPSYSSSPSQEQPSTSRGRDADVTPKVGKLVTRYFFDNYGVINDVPILKF